MINVYIPSFFEKPKEQYPYKNYASHVPAIVHVPTTTENKDKEGLSIEAEMARRQTIIDKLLLNFKYKVGDSVYMSGHVPAGVFDIVYIVKQAIHIRYDWPNTDNPLIITLRKKDNFTEVIHATTNRVGELVK